MALSIAILSEFNGDGIQRARKEFEQLEGVGAKAGFALKKAMLPATAALGALAAAAGKTVNAASDLGESVNAVNVTFGDAAKDVLKLGENAAKTVGLSKRAFNGLAVQFSSFAYKIAGDGGDVTKVLQTITTRAADFASVMNIDVADAAAKFQSGLAGEAEPLKQFGIDISDASIKAFALANNIGDASGELTEQEKVLARYGSIMEQTDKTSGDFLNTSDSLANSQRTLEASLEDTQAAIGTALLPVVEAVLPYLQDFADWSSENPDKFHQIAAAIAAIAASVVLLNTAMKASIFFNAAGALGGIGVLVAGFAAAYASIDSFRVNVNAQYNKWVGYIEGTINTLVRAFNPILDFLNLISPGNPFARLGLVDIPRLDTTPASQKGAGFAALDQIPMMADGGIIRHSPGGTLALIGEGGRDEAVIPLDRMGGMGGNNVTINVNGGDPNAVVNALRTYMRQNGSVPIRVSNIF
jgi:hypothetical protein